MAAYLFMNLGAFACIILFSLRTGSDRIADYAGLYQKDPLITLGLSLCLLSLGGIPPMLGFFGKIYLFFAGWADHQYLLVVVGLVTSVVSIYYYISVIKMMVVKEPQDASDVVKAYPAITWNLAGMQPLRAALVGCVVITAVVISVVSWNLLRFLSGGRISQMSVLENTCMASAASSAAQPEYGTVTCPISTTTLVRPRLDSYSLRMSSLVARRFLRFSGSALAS
jgi:NAD(P)H-quinone oxidoreductase subunit 2